MGLGSYLKLKNEFITVVSHELRTPLTALKGALGLLGEGPEREDSKQRTELQRIAKANAERLGQLVDDLLDKERIRAGKLTLEIIPFRPGPMVQSVLRDHESSVKVVVHSSDGFLRIALTDQGPGIPVVFRDRIFQPFSQADGSDRRGQGGTGLELSICKALVERIGGRIGFESQEEEGSTFWFDLPVAS